MFFRTKGPISSLLWVFATKGLKFAYRNFRQLVLSLDFLLRKRAYC